MLNEQISYYSVHFPPLDLGQIKSCWARKRPWGPCINTKIYFYGLLCHLFGNGSIKICLRLGIYRSSLPLNKKIYRKRSVTGTGRLWHRSTHGWPNRCGEVTRPQRPFRFIYLFRSPQEQSAGLPCFELAVYSVTQMR